MKSLIFSPTIMLFTLTYATQNEFKYNDPNTWNMTMPENILQYLDYLDAIDLSNFLRNSSVTDDHKCNEDFLSIFQDLRENYQWPKVSVLDAGNAMQHALFDGNRLAIGNYDECLSVNPPHRNFTGKYCLGFIDDTIDPVNLEGTGYYWFRRPIYGFGLCIPSTCSAEYLNRILNEILIPSTNESFSDKYGIGVNDEDCHTINESQDFTTLNWITIAVLGIVMACMLASTLYGILKKDKPSQLYLAFSIPKNLSQIFSTSQSSKISTMAGIRALCAIYTVFGHVYYVALNANARNLHFGELSVFGDTYGMLMINHGLTAVDCFLFLSGILIVFSFLNEVKRHSQYDPGAAFIKRYLRLMSPVAFLFLIRMGIADRFYTGPVSKTMNKFFQASCKGDVWATLLMYSNFVQIPTKMCVQHLWYIFVDLQLSVVSQFFFIYALWYKKRIVPILGIFCWGSAVLEFIIAYINDIGPSPAIDHGNMLKMDYAIPYARSVPWLGGMFLGFWLHHNLKHPLKISKVQALIAWIICFICASATLYPLCLFNATDYEQPWGSLYLSFRRVTWNIAMGILLVLCANDRGGYIRKILSWAPLKFFDNIALELYIVHFQCLEFIASASKDTIYMSYARVWYWTFADLPFCVFFAILLALMVTAPMNIIIQQCLPQLKIIPIKNHWKAETHSKAEALA